MKAFNQERSTLVLALLAGLSINGACSALFSPAVPFSIFPLISLILTVWGLHQRYLRCAMAAGLPGIAASCFVLGVLIYSAVVRVQYPDIGSNFLPSVLSVALLFWIGFRLRARYWP
ncbi:YijD family membrane protein [Apirhabdus apintestini]|uniref:YijD family membrane protein n=1 Tax=Erwinia sp. HR93 TaxID=3094840 RepID=UPI002ADEF252|nr:YijD family membrane protein [Erwinia sp. HR93]MEA1062683.1 YijD family membrane protein [Erwinia sp. HR93]WPM84717.1 YijD family membrane protein [Enterobacteriaceae bacterium CA-0114]